MGGKGESVFRKKVYKGHMDKAKRGVGSRIEGGDAWGGEWWRENGDNCT